MNIFKISIISFLMSIPVQASPNYCDSVAYPIIGNLTLVAFREYSLEEMEVTKLDQKAGSHQKHYKVEIFFHEPDKESEAYLVKLHEPAYSNGQVCVVDEISRITK